MEDNFEKNISKIRNYISNIFNGFNVWKSLQKAEYNEIYNKDKYFWGIVIYSLQSEFLLGLAKIFEKSKRTDILSIYYLLNLLPEGKEKDEIKNEIIGFDGPTKNLIIWRNNILAHQNIFFAHNPQELFKTFPIKNQEIEGLMKLLEKVLGMIHSVGTKTGQIYSFKLFEEESLRDTEDIIKKLKLAHEIEIERRKARYGI